MPPRGAKKGSKRARQYEHIKEGELDRGASESRAEDIAARTVNKERARAGESRQRSRTSIEDISSGRRGGKRSGRPGPRGRTRERAARERAGLRRLRPGPGSASFSPFIGQPPPITDPSRVDEEIEIIVRALDEHGRLSREELARRIGARYWGPGRFRTALREALAEGAARRAGRNLYATARPGAGRDPDPSEAGAR
jgi:hypothetical protein